MKTAGHEVELVTEYPKELTYDGDVRRLSNSALILAEQYDRLNRLEGQVRTAITDSPLPMILAYAGRWGTPAFRTVIREAFGHFDNVSFFVERAKPYQTYGRKETEEEAHDLDRRVRVLSADFVGTSLVRVVGDDSAADIIYRRIKGSLA